MWTFGSRTGQELTTALVQVFIGNHRKRNPLDYLSAVFLTEVTNSPDMCKTPFVAESWKKYTNLFC